MKFKNPENGYTEEKLTPWLWTLLFGGLYFIVSGMWAPFVVWLLLGVVLIATMGSAGVLLMMVAPILISPFAPGMVRNSYLRKGWIEVGDEYITNKEIPTDEVSEPKVESIPFSGERDLSSTNYQLFLTRRFTIEKNSTLEKFVIGDDVYNTLQESLTVANERYEAHLIGMAENAERAEQVLKDQCKQEEERRSEIAKRNDNERREVERKYVPMIYLFAVIGFIFAVIMDRRGSEQFATTSIAPTKEVKAELPPGVTSDMQRVNSTCGATRGQMEQWFSTHKTGWVEHTEEVANCVRTHQ